MKKISIHLALVSTLFATSTLATSKTQPAVSVGQKVHKEIKSGQIVPTNPPTVSTLTSGDKSKSKK